MRFDARLRPRTAVALLLLAVACAACGPTSVLPTPTPEPSPTPTPWPPDLVPPAVTAQDPLPDGELAARGVVRVTFSEPVRGVDRSSFQLSDASGAVVIATVTLDPAARTAMLVPIDGLTIASAFEVRLTAAVHDLAGNPLVPVSWKARSGNEVEFAAGTYDGYQFGASASELIGFKRATLTQPSSATASEYRVVEGNGYLLINAGTWAGYWVPGAPSGVAVDDQAAPIPSLPTCAYLDLPVARSAYADWSTSVLDTVFQLPQRYAPRDLTDTKKAGLNGGYLIRSVAIDDLSEMVAAARVAGASLAVQSAYRSYAGQVLTFNDWVSRVGHSEALQTSARPGHSEHQLGTAIDFRSVGGAAAWTYPDWARTKEGAWLAANAWTFGWVMSYPKGKSAVACYRYEPWHYRYVGRDEAAAIHDAGLTPREWLWGQGYGVR